MLLTRRRAAVSSVGHHAAVKPITRASLGASRLSFKDAVWGLLCARHTVWSCPGKGFGRGEEDSEQWSHFDLATLEETFNAIVNSKPRPGGGGGWVAMLVLCLWSLCNPINIDA